MQKISAEIDKKKLIWLGIRESDVADTGNSLFGFSGFEGSITIFGSGMNGNRAMEKETGKRINHNSECEGFEDFFKKTMEEMTVKDRDIRFLPYDALDYESFPQYLQERIIAHNEYEILDQLEHKLYLRQYYSSMVNVPPYFVVSAGECTWEKLKQLFPEKENYVLQRDYSCGGSGTFLIRNSTVGQKNCDKVIPMVTEIEDEERILVSPFFERNISVNIHCVIYPEKILLFAPSVQLIDQQHERLTYLGSDFSAVSQIDSNSMGKIRQVTDLISRDLRDRGYRGVCGIDMLLAEGECYFMEVNARFQASSAILNKDLKKKGLPSLQEYHLDAFVNTEPSLPIPPETATGSFITLHYFEKEKDNLQWLGERIRESPAFDLVDDAIDWDSVLEEYCYVFQLRSSEQISSVTFHNTVRIHPNVNLVAFYPDSKRSYNNILHLKTLMLTRGVFVTPQAWEFAKKKGGFDWEEFDAVTLKLWKDIWVTAPCMGKWEMISPISLEADFEKENFWLSLYGNRLIEAEVMEADPNAEKKSSGGHYYGDIVYMNPDRLRVYHRDGCIYQDRGVGCKFCDLYGTGKRIEFEEIKEALDLYWENLRVDHFLIGGGSDLAEEEYQSVKKIAQYIHSHSERHIYLMTTPINNLERLKALQESGITEVSFNIEIIDRVIATKVMPGKAAIPEQYYMESLKKASTVFGAAGEVRCAVVVGFDDMDTFAAGIRKICEAGAAPILSLYRICPNTELENYMPIGEKEALMYYNTACKIAKEYGLRLGPSCRACQNNTMALDL